MVSNRWNPWDGLFSAHDQLYTDVLGRPLAPERLMHTLALDIRQMDDTFEIEASVPGFRPEDVEIAFDENVLTICGTRHEDEVTQGTYVRRERNAHSLYRQIGLPAEVKTDEITARFDGGVLTIVVPRTKRAEPKRIPVVPTVEHAKRLEPAATAALPA